MIQQKGGVIHRTTLKGDHPTALALVDVWVFIRPKSASVRRKSIVHTYSDFPIKSCTPVSNSRDVYIGIENWPFDLPGVTPYFRKPSVRNGKKKRSVLGNPTERTFFGQNLLHFLPNFIPIFGVYFCKTREQCFYT